MLWNVTLTLLTGLGTTIQIFFLTLLFALPLGLVIAFGSMSKWRPFKFLLRPKRVKDPRTGEIVILEKPREPGKAAKALAAFRPISALCSFLVWIVRGTPLMLQLIGFFYIPGILGLHIWPGGEAGRMVATVVAFSLNYACYFSVIYRGGIQSVPVGQREAGQVLGMTRQQIFFKITLLQMVKRIVPPMSNEIITLVKDTSLARIIAVYELTFTGYSFIKNDGLVWPLFYTGVFYLLFVGILTILFNFIERKLDYFR